MSSAKLIRHGMERVGPTPAGKVVERITSVPMIKALLIAKLHEEAQEAADAPAGQPLLSELGDIYEVLHSLAAMYGYRIEQVHQEASRKADERGNLLSSWGAYSDLPAALLLRDKE